MINIGTNSISNVFVGTTQAQMVCLGTTIVWQYQSGSQYVIPQELDQQYFTTQALADSCTITMVIPSNVSTTDLSYVEYSTDSGITWTKVNNSSSSVSITVTIDTDEFVLWRGSGNRTASGTTYNGSNYYTNITANQQFKVYGNIMSLIYEDQFINKTSFPTSNSCTFAALFYNSTNLVNAEDLIMPSQTLTTDCYNDMFRQTSIQISPVLPARTLATSCYKRMFTDSHSLNTVKMYATNVSASNCLQNWLNSTATVGTFYKNAAATWTGNIPPYWTVQTVTVD